MESGHGTNLCMCALQEGQVKVLEKRTRTKRNDMTDNKVGTNREWEKRCNGERSRKGSKSVPYSYKHDTKFKKWLKHCFEFRVPQQLRTKHLKDLNEWRVEPSWTVKRKKIATMGRDGMKCVYAIVACEELEVRPPNPNIFRRSDVGAASAACLGSMSKLQGIKY